MTENPSEPHPTGHTPRRKTPAELEEMSESGSGWVKPFGLALISLALMALVVAAVYALWAFWPYDGAKKVKVLGYHHKMSEETRLFVTVALAGYLGGLVHALRSFVWYVGNRKVRRAWIPFYFLTPMIGAGLATIFYLVFRGGLLSSNADADAVNPWGLAAVAALVGLFSNEALERLKCVAEQLFAPAPEGEDHEPPKGKKSDEERAEEHKPNAGGVPPPPPPPATGTPGTP